MPRCVSWGHVLVPWLPLKTPLPPLPFLLLPSSKLETCLGFGFTLPPPSAGRRGPFFFFFFSCISEWGVCSAPPPTNSNSLAASSMAPYSDWTWRRLTENADVLGIVGRVLRCSQLFFACIPVRSGKPKLYRFYSEIYPVFFFHFVTDIQVCLVSRECFSWGSDCVVDFLKTITGFLDVFKRRCCSGTRLMRISLSRLGTLNIFYSAHGWHNRVRFARWLWWRTLMSCSTRLQHTQTLRCLTLQADCSCDTIVLGVV